MEAAPTGDSLTACESIGGRDMSARALVHEFGMGVDVHGRDSTKAACRAVSDAIRHSSLPVLRTYLEGGGRILIDVTVGVPGSESVDVERVQRELPLGEVTVCAVEARDSPHCDAITIPTTTEANAIRIV